MGEEKDILISRHEHLILRCKEYLPAIDRFTYPIFVEVEKRPGRLLQIGSGVALQKNERSFLVTAEHVLDNILDSGRDVYIADGTNEMPGSVYRLPENTRQGWRLHPKEQLDLAVLPIDTRLRGLQLFPSEKITRGYMSTRGHYFLAGYPNSKNKEWDVNPRGEPKRTGIASIIVKVDQGLDFATDKKNPNDYLGFKYDRVFDESGHPQQGTALRGLSGCGLWFFPNENVANPLLAGIFIEFWKGSKNGYATLANYLHELL